MMVGEFHRLTGGVHMRRIRYALLVFVFMVGLYLGLTWFFFGSPHPCGILEARQRPYEIKKLTESYWVEARAWNQLAREALRSEFWDKIDKEHSEAVERYINAADEAAARLHKEVWRQTPAQCFWQAITWRDPQD
jgi:hypothetical protein